MVPSRAGGSSAGLRLQAVLVAVARLSFVTLVGFHAWRFVAQAAGGQLLAPDVALRWGAGLALFAAIAALRRVGVPLFRGRKAAVLWTLVFLLHWHAAVSRPLAPSGHPAIPEAAEAVSGFSAGVLLLAGAVLLGLVTAARPDRRERVIGLVATRPLARARSAGHRLCLAPRPPPA